jgi:hypothetical protein
MDDTTLMVRQCSGLEFWTIERWDASREYNNADEALVHRFGSTPILARSYQAAMRLAMYCHVGPRQTGLGWISACPKNHEVAVEIARKRRIDESGEPLTLTSTAGVQMGASPI